MKEAGLCFCAPFSVCGCRTKGNNSTHEIDEKKPFLEPSMLTLYHSVAGRLGHLSRLPVRTDVNEWMATNGKCNLQGGKEGEGNMIHCCILWECWWLLLCGSQIERFTSWEKGGEVKWYHSHFLFH